MNTHRNRFVHGWVSLALLAAFATGCASMNKATKGAIIGATAGASRAA